MNKNLLTIKLWSSGGGNSAFVSLFSKSRMVTSKNSYSLSTSCIAYLNLPNIIPSSGTKIAANHSDSVAMNSNSCCVGVSVPLSMTH